MASSVNLRSVLVKKIKEKKELSGIADFVVEDILNNYTKKNRIDLENAGKLKLSSWKFIVKSVRAELREYAGRFTISGTKAQALLDKNKISKLLKTRSATKERLDFYPVLKRKILKLKPKSILDLGCGINPIALSDKKINYYACDINEADLSLVRSYFKKNKIKGRVFVCDLRKPGNTRKLPRADLCLIFKLFDVLEAKGHKLAEKIIKNLKCSYLLISFPTKTLSNKPMRHPQRGWIKRLLSRLGFKSKTFQSNNEIFYLAYKQKV